MGKHTKAYSVLIRNSDEKQRPKWLKYLKGVHTRRVLLARVRQLIYHWGCGKERQHLTCTRALPDDRENRLVHYCCCCCFWPLLFPFLFHWPLLLTLWGGWIPPTNQREGWLFCQSVSRLVGFMSVGITLWIFGIYDCLVDVARCCCFFFYFVRAKPSTKNEHIRLRNIISMPNFDQQSIPMPMTS